MCSGSKGCSPSGREFHDSSQPVLVLTMVLCRFIIIVQWATAAAQTVDASRVVFAFARDDALPGSRWTKQINARTQTPVYAVIFVVFSSAVLGLMALNVQAGLALFVRSPLFHRTSDSTLTLVSGRRCHRTLSLIRHSHPPPYHRVKSVHSCASLHPLVEFLTDDDSCRDHSTSDAGPSLSELLQSHG